MHNDDERDYAEEQANGRLLREDEEHEPNRGLHLSVYRDALLGDCTNGGITSRYARLTLVGIVDYAHRKISGDPSLRRLPAGSRVFAPSEDAPPVWLVIGRHRDDDMYLVPGRTDANEPDRRWWMMGGNYAATSDSRFSELAGHVAIRVHDRHEG